MKKIIFITFLLCYVTSVWSQSEGYIFRDNFLSEQDIIYDIMDNGDGTYLLFVRGKQAESYYMNYYFYEWKDDFSFRLLDSLRLFEEAVDAYRPKLHKQRQQYKVMAGSSSENKYIFAYDPLSETVTTDLILPRDTTQGQLIKAMENIDSTHLGVIYATEPYGSNLSDREYFILMIEDNQILDTIPILYPPSFEALGDPRLKKSSDNSLMFGGWVTGVLGEDSHVRLYLAEYSLEGNLIWKYIMPSGFEEFRLHDMYFPEDNQYIYMVGTSPGINKLMKLNKETLMIDQHTEICPDNPLISENRNSTYFQIIESQEKDGLILIGHTTNPETFIQSAIVSKISYEGDCIWHRNFTINPTTFDKHYLYSIRPTHDGGYISVGSHAVLGEVINDTFPYFAALIIKMDAEGILSSIDEAVTLDEVNIKAFPNPTSGVLHIYQEDNRNLHYTVLDQGGNMIESFEHNNPDTYIIHNVAQYPRGVYYLRVEDRLQNRISTQAFVIE